MVFWQTCCLDDWLIFWSAGALAGWFFVWLAFLVGWLLGCMAFWLISYLVGCLAASGDVWGFVGRTLVKMICAEETDMFVLYIFGSERTKASKVRGCMPE